MAGRSTLLHPTRSVCLLAVLAAAPLFLAGCGDDPSGPGLGDDNLYQLVITSDDLQLLGGIVERAALDVALRSETNLTFFAPTDEALLGLGPEMLASLNSSANRDVLTKLVRRHLVRGRFRTADLSDGTTLEPLEGPPLEVRVEGERVTVGGAEITDADHETGNGVLHELGELVRDHLTLAERLRVTPLISTFAQALEAAGLTHLLQAGQPYTLFLPINSAFADLGTAELETLLRLDNRSILQKVLRRHIVPGRVGADQLTDGNTLTPLEGTPLTVEAENGRTYLDGSRVIVQEVETSEGLIYLLGTVVMGHLDLAERLQIAPHLTTSYRILRDAGVLGQLRGDGAYSVFAPSDLAWEPLGLSLLPALTTRPALRLRTAQYSVVPERLDREALLEGGTLTTLGGYDLPIVLRSDVGGIDVFVGDRGRVAFPPIEARNGLLYTIAPYNVPPDVNLEERAVFTGLYRFLNLMNRTGLTPLLQQEEQPYTIFAPTDAALDGVSIPDAQLARTLRYHIVPGIYEVGDLPPTIPDSLFFRLPTLEGSDIKGYPAPGGGMYLNCSEVEHPEFPDVIILQDCITLNEPNLRATNGVIHTLNARLRLP